MKVKGPKPNNPETNRSISTPKRTANPSVTLQPNINSWTKVFILFQIIELATLTIVQIRPEKRWK